MHFIEEHFLFIAAAIRHKPSVYEIVLNKNSYTNVDELISKLNAHNENISFEILQRHHVHLKNR